MDYRIRPTAAEIIAKVDWLEGELSNGRDAGYSHRIAHALATIEGPQSEPRVSNVASYAWSTTAIRRQLRWLIDEALPLSESQCTTAGTEDAYHTAYDRQIEYANRLFAALEILEGSPRADGLRLDRYTRAASRHGLRGGR